jgi:MoaA/NifB/PqqE/SkfB family radical SAM enzyme
MGEPLFIPKWRETAYKILAHDHVWRLSFVSNLSQKLQEFLDRVDPTRIGVVASLHPSEFKDHDRDFQGFIEKILFLKNLGVSIVVNYVVTPDQLPRFDEYRSSIIGVGVPMTMNILRGPYRGKIYPEAYTQEELKKVRECFNEIPFIYDSQSHELNPYGGKCTSGRSGFYLEFDGSLYNCHFAFQRFGSIYDESLMVRAQNGYCTATKCESQTTIGWREDVVNKYIMQDTLHHFIKREQDFGV